MNTHVLISCGRIYTLHLRVHVNSVAPNCRLILCAGRNWKRFGRLTICEVGGLIAGSNNPFSLFPFRKCLWTPSFPLASAFWDLSYFILHALTLLDARFIRRRLINLNVFLFIWTFRHKVCAKLVADCLRCGFDVCSALNIQVSSRWTKCPTKRSLDSNLSFFETIVVCLLP